MIGIQNRRCWTDRLACRDARKQFELAQEPLVRNMTLMQAPTNTHLDFGVWLIRRAINSLIAGVFLGPQHWMRVAFTH
ncbi:hypothetical protein C2U39_06765 [Aeromonas sp. ASNIH3]|nr:hypothetical protein C2U39_06765 [Aeromonas sp. ASNIH3]